MSQQDTPPEVLAIIPARGGSKGLPRKNILPLSGIPLVAWSIRAAQEAKLVTRIVVSTDDEEIATVAKQWGAEVPFLRPRELAKDRSNIQDGVNHTLEQLQTREGYIPDSYCVLYPTHPFRVTGLIDTLTDILISQQRLVVTAKRLEFSSYSHLVPCPGGHEFLDPGSDHDHIFRPYGMYEGKPLQQVRKGVYIHLLDDPIQLMDIDTATDFALANAIVERGLFPVPEASCE